MSTHTTAHVGSAVGGFERPYEHEATHTADRSAHQAYGLLRFAFVVAPILAGADKFFHYLVDWDQYLSPFVSNLVGGRVHQFMMAAGVVEIAAGVGVALMPGVFAYVIAVWLWGIIVNLMLVPGYYDIALRDFGLSLAALALGRLSTRTARRA